MIDTLKRLKDCMIFKSIKIVFLDDGSIYHTDKKCMEFLNMDESFYPGEIPLL